MVRLCATFLLWATVACFGETQKLDQQLASGEPREVAWAAYTMGLQKRFDLAPKLVSLVGSFEGGSIVDQGAVPAEAAAMEAIADALIQLRAEVPAAVVMHLYPRFPAQTIILLARAPDNLGPLTEIFRNTTSRDLWLAAANLLALQRPPGFVRALLGEAITTFSFRLVSTGTEGNRRGEGGCAYDSYMPVDERFRDWPRARLYRITHRSVAAEIFAPGIHPVGYSWWNTTDYRDHWQDSDCSEAISRYWRSGLIAQLLDEDMKDLPLKPLIEETVRFTSPVAFRGQVRSAVEHGSRAFKEVVEAFVKRGDLTLDESAALHFQCRLEMVDDRPPPHGDLPQVAGELCAASPVAGRFRLP